MQMPLRTQHQRARIKRTGINLPQLPGVPFELGCNPRRVPQQSVRYARKNRPEMVGYILARVACGAWEVFVPAIAVRIYWREQEVVTTLFRNPPRSRVFLQSRESDHALGAIITSKEVSNLVRRISMEQRRSLQARGCGDRVKRTWYIEGGDRARAVLLCAGALIYDLCRHCPDVRGTAE